MKTCRTRFQTIFRFGVGRALLLTLTGIICFNGCSQSTSTEALEKARQLLALDKADEALDALPAGDECSDEAHYLKAIALERLGRHDTAKEEIERALELTPDEPKYQGLQLRQPLLRADFSVADQLIALYEQNRTCAPLALFAFYAHESKRLILRKQNQDDSAQEHRVRGLEALKNAIRLSAQAQEFQREMLAFAIKHGLTSEATDLIDRLIAIAPDDPKLMKDKISVLVLTRQMDKAVRLAASFHRKQEESEETARLLAAVLVNAESSEEHDKMFLDLVEQYPRNGNILEKCVLYLSRAPANADRDKRFRQLCETYPTYADVVAKYSIYLTRSARLKEACAMLADHLDGIQDEATRGKLINMAVSLPMEAGVAPLAQEQLDRYKDQLAGPALVTYFEGRLLFLEQKHEEALKKMAEVVDAQKNDAGQSRALALEALNWMKRIRVDQAVKKQLESAAETTRQPDSPQPAPAATNPESTPATTPEATSSDS